MIPDKAIQAAAEALALRFADRNPAMFIPEARAALEAAVPYLTADAANTPLPADHEAIVHAQKQGHENGWNAAGAALRDMRDELSRSRAECQHLNDRLDEAGEAIDAARAERDALRDAITALADASKSGVVGVVRLRALLDREVAQ